jgi:hypothetical protein
LAYERAEGIELLEDEPVLSAAYNFDGWYTDD